MLSENGIDEKEQEQNPQMMLNIMETFKTNLGDREDGVWHKFDNAKVSNSPVSGSSMYSPSTPGTGMSPGGFTPLGGMTSPPASPRFPQNHETSFENPRAPPPVPRRGSAGPLSPNPSGMSSLVPTRAAPRPPGQPNLTLA